MAEFRCFPGESLRIGVDGLTDPATGDYVTSLGAGGTATYAVTRTSDGTSIATGALTGGTLGDWYATVTMSTTPGRYKIKRTMVVTGLGTRIFVDYVEVEPE